MACSYIHAVKPKILKALLKLKDDAYLMHEWFSANRLNVNPGKL